MATKKITNVFSLKEVFMEGWEGFKKNAYILIGIQVIISLIPIISFLPLSFAIDISPSLVFISPLIMFLIYVLMSYFMLSMIKASLIILNGQKATWDILKNDMSLFLKFLCVAILFSIIVATGSLLLVIPMFFALAIFFPAQYIIVNEKDATISGSFKKSWAITKNHFIECLTFVIICSFITFLGLFLFGIGLFIAAPIVLIAAASAYKKLEAAYSAAIPGTTTEA